MGSWNVDLADEVGAWLQELRTTDPEAVVRVAAAIDQLEAKGPTLGRPYADRVKGSKHHNMKELRPRSVSGQEIRILFMFDPDRNAILLVAGDKTGNWDGWYEDNIAVAEQRYERHLQQRNEGTRADDEELARRPRRNESRRRGGRR
jgi:hypothetical protein